jgi:transcriptional regulator with XRE-family HTH domain
MMTRDRFKRIRLFLEMSQVEFAEFLGISVSAVGMIEIGQRNVSDRVSAKIAHKFEITPEFEVFTERVKKFEEL